MIFFFFFVHFLLFPKAPEIIVSKMSFTQPRPCPPSTLGQTLRQWQIQNGVNVPASQPQTQPAPSNHILTQTQTQSSSFFLSQERPRHEDMQEIVNFSIIIL